MVLVGELLNGEGIAAAALLMTSADCGWKQLWYSFTVTKEMQLLMFKWKHKSWELLNERMWFYAGINKNREAEVDIFYIVRVCDGVQEIPCITQHT